MAAQPRGLVSPQVIIGQGGESSQPGPIKMLPLARNHLGTVPCRADRIWRGKLPRFPPKPLEVPRGALATEEASLPGVSDTAESNHCRSHLVSSQLPCQALDSHCLFSSPEPSRFGVVIPIS